MFVKGLSDNYCELFEGELLMSRQQLEQVEQLQTTLNKMQVTLDATLVVPDNLKWFPSHHFQEFKSFWVKRGKSALAMVIVVAS